MKVFEERVGLVFVDYTFGISGPHQLDDGLVFG